MYEFEISFGPTPPLPFRPLVVLSRTVDARRMISMPYEAMPTLLYRKTEFSNVTVDPFSK
jgi:hypothetical protein